MIKVKYDSWEKITVNVFEKLNTAIENAEVTGNKDVDLLNKQIAILSVLCDVDEDTIADLHTSEFSKLTGETDFLNESPKKNIINKITLNGKEYEIFLNIGDMTMSQYIDFQTLFPKRDKEFKRILSIFIIPKGCNYNEGYDIEQVINDIGDYMPITDANNIMFFFALAYQSLTKVMLTCLEKEMKKLKKKEKDTAKVEQMQIAIDKLMEAKHLVENGDGFIM